MYTTSYIICQKEELLIAQWLYEKYETKSEIFELCSRTCMIAALEEAPQPVEMCKR